MGLPPQYGPYVNVEVICYSTEVCVVVRDVSVVTDVTDVCVVVTDVNWRQNTALQKYMNSNRNIFIKQIA